MEHSNGKCMAARLLLSTAAKMLRHLKITPCFHISRCDSYGSQSTLSNDNLMEGSTYFTKHSAVIKGCLCLTNLAANSNNAAGLC